MPASYKYLHYTLLNLRLWLLKAYNAWRKAVLMLK